MANNTSQSIENDLKRMGRMARRDRIRNFFLWFAEEDKWYRIGVLGCWFAAAVLSVGVWVWLPYSYDRFGAFIACLITALLAGCATIGTCAILDECR